LEDFYELKQARFDFASTANVAHLRRNRDVGGIRLRRLDAAANEK
jgi:hypothetical protein